jgi:hypothetical protein
MMLKFDVRHVALAAIVLMAAARLPAQELARAQTGSQATAIVAAANPLAADAGVEILQQRRQRGGRCGCHPGDAGAR